MMGRVVKNIIKALLVIVIIGYLIHDGRLDLSKISQLYRQPWKASLLIVLFVLGPICVASFRWWLFVTRIKPEVPFPHVIRIVLQSTFLSLAIPGSGGVDIIKALLLFKREGFSNKTPLAITVLIDRIMGVTALLTLAVVTSLFHPLYSADAHFHLVLMAAYVVLGILAFSAFLLLGPFAWPGIMMVRVAQRLPSRFPEKLVLAVIEHRHHKRLLLLTFVLSIVIQMVQAIMFVLIFYLLQDHAVGFQMCLVLVPIGILSTLLPVGPGGIGAGYLGFAYLFQMAGVGQGANAYNLFVLIQLLCSLLAGLALIGHSKEVSVKAA